LFRIATIFVVTLCCSSTAGDKKAAQPKSLEPTEEQLSAAHEAYVKLGASYRASYNWRRKKTTHIFRFPRSTTDNDVKALVDLPFAFALDFGGVELSDGIIKNLKPLKKLTELTLWGARITDAGLNELTEFKNLTLLNLWATHATQTGVDDLQDALPKCEIVFVGDVKPIVIHAPFEPISEQMVIAKEAFAKIGASYLVDTDPWSRRITHYFSLPRRTTDADLKNVPNLPFRFGLDLEGTRVTDAGLRELAGFTSLAGLVLSNTEVTDAGLKSLRNSGNLTRLDLENTRVTDAGLLYLSRLKKLTRLNLSRTQVTDGGLPRLKDLAYLTHLNLSFTKVSDDSLNELIDLDRLVELNLAGTGATDFGIKQLQGFLRRCKIWK
jgi:internalin A